MLKRTSVVAGTFAVAMSLGVAFAVAAAPPEIDNANVKLAMQPTTTFTPTRCAGEDATTYVTYRGAWQGGETETTPGLTDYNLSGPVSVTKAVWTINTRTQGGVLTAAMTLLDPATGGPTYAGRLTLVTQGMPAGNVQVIPARGFVVANTYTGGVADGGHLIANIEMQITPTFTATGIFGDATGTMNTPNYSVTTANQVC